MALLEDGEAKLQEALNSLALAGTPFLFFDNVDWDGHTVKTELLDQWISGQEHEFRKLHGHDMMSPKLRGVTLMTGNKLTLSPDLQRRSLMVDLWNPMAGSERVLPEGTVLLDQQFFDDPEQRKLVLASLWSIVRLWDEAGRPKNPGRELGTFEDWSRIIPGMVYHAGLRFGKVWNCRAENSNLEVGDKASRDWKALAEKAMAELGPVLGVMRPRFEVLVSALAGVARRNMIETAQHALWPEKDVEAVFATEGKGGGWQFKEPKGLELSAAEDDAERRKQAAEYLTSKSGSAFGLATKGALHERQFLGLDGLRYQWRHVAGASPSRYAVERVG
jgi:hypothetical protein